MSPVAPAIGRRHRQVLIVRGLRLGLRAGILLLHGLHEGSRSFQGLGGRITALLQALQLAHERVDHRGRLAALRAARLGLSVCCAL
jgi:hypothetical protein